MNERYALQANLAELTGEFRVDRIEFRYEEREHYAPTGPIPVIRTVDRERRLGGQRWGLMPYWGKSSIHVDRHMLGDKPYLMSMLARKRCVVPCSGQLFDRTEGKANVTYRRKHAAKPVFGIAGLFDVWVDSEKNEYPMCTLLSSGFSDSGEEGRYPLVLEREAMDIWLDPRYNAANELRDLLRSIPEAEFHTEPVAPAPDDARHAVPWKLK